MIDFRKSKSKIIFLVTGLVSTIWFLIRVIPKPSRANYPCQKAAFPVATTFLIWMVGTVATMFSVQKTRKALKTKRHLKSVLYAGITLIVFTVTYLIIPSENLIAKVLYIVEEQPELRLDYSKEDKLITPQAVVSIVKSEKTDVKKIDQNEIEQMVRKAVEMAGGVDDIVNDGDTVVLKVNLVSYDNTATGFTTEANGMVTDWRVAGAMAKIVRELNPSGKIFIMEGSAGNSTDEAFRILKYTKENLPEVDDLIAIESNSGEWHDFESNKLISASLPEGKKLYENNGKPNNTDNYYYNKLYYEADVLISIPVLKNHETAGVTGAVKNLGIGATPTNIYGNSSNQNGRWNIIAHNGIDLHKFIHDFYYLRPADFALMDGIQGWNNGPVLMFGSNNFAGHQENMGVILASKNPVALDAIESLIMGDNPRKVPHLVYLDNSEKGCADPNAIQVKGTKVHEIKKNFPHEENRTQCTYTDYTEPDVHLQVVEFSENNLNLSFSNPDQIKSVEIKIDDNYVPVIAVNDFESVAIDLSEVEVTDTILTIYAHDEYLNTKVFTLKGYSDITAISDNRQNDELNCYPNPVINTLTFDLKNSYFGTIEISVYSINGAHVLSESINKNSSHFSHTLNLASQAKGIYILNVLSGNEHYTKKISKK